MRIITWPDILVPRDIEFFLAPRTKTGGPALNGFTQVVGPPNDIWRAEFTFPPQQQDGVRLYRALQADMAGRLVGAWLKVWDRFGWDYATAYGVTQPTADIPFSDTALFSDGSGFAPPKLRVPLDVAGSQYDVEVTLDSTQLVGAVPSGVYVSIGGWLHQVIAAGAASGGQVVMRIRPGLREDFAVGTEVDFEPRVLVRFASDETGRLPLNFGRWGEPTIQVEEVMNRDGLSV